MENKTTNTFYMYIYKQVAIRSFGEKDPWRCSVLISDLEEEITEAMNAQYLIPTIYKTWGLE